MSKREQILTALFALIQYPGPTFDRNVALPIRIPAAGLAIMRDGVPGEPEVTLSPLEYIYAHAVTLEIMVQDVADPDAVLDVICETIGQAIEGDRTLGGLCDWIEGQAPEAVELYVEGAEPIKAVALTLMLNYGTSHPI